jgi:integrase
MPMRCLSVAARRFAPSKVLLPFPISSTRPCAALVVVRPSRGAAHLLRHSLATSMLWQGASPEDIGAVLLHSSAETTQIYAKVDIPTLREIAQPWPEV